MTRFLTSSEIEYILDIFQHNPNIPRETAESIVNNHKNKIRKQLEQVEINPTLIEKLKEEIHRQYI